MSLSTWMPVPYRIPPVAAPNSSLSKVSKVVIMNKHAHPPLQVKVKEKCMSSATSRREMLQLTTASLGVFSQVLPASAEAAARDATIGQKILQILEELSQKVGLSKPKDEGEDNKQEAAKTDKSKALNGTKEAKDEGEVQNGGEETKPEPKDEKKHTQESKVAPTEGEATSPLPGSKNGKSVETTPP